MKRADGGVKPGLRFFPQPLSRLTATAPRPGSLLACATAAQKLSPRAGKVAVSVSERSKGVRLGSGFAIFSVPLSFAYAQQLPRKRWSLLVRFTNSYIKPALKGEVAFAEQKTEGVKISRAERVRVGCGFRFIKSRRELISSTEKGRICVPFHSPMVYPSIPLIPLIVLRAYRCLCHPRAARRHSFGRTPF